MARWAAFIARHHNPDAAWLTVDAGNYVDRGATGGCSDKCQFVVTSYADLHYDVLNLGKQEVWMGYETLVALMDTTPNTDFVSANLVDAKTHKPVAKPYVIKDYGNLRVGVVGLLNETDFPPGTALLDTNSMRVLPAVEAAKKYIPSLARKVDAVILLADLPTTTLDTLLVAVPDVDFVISAGALRTGEQPAKIAKTQVIGTGSSGYSGHYSMLEFNPAWGDSIGFSNYQDQLGDNYDEKGLWADRLAAFEAKPAAPKPIAPQTTPDKSKMSPSGTSVTPIKPPPGKVSARKAEQG